MNFTKTLGVVSLALILVACSKQAEEQPTPPPAAVQENLPKQAVSPMPRPAARRSGWTSRRPAPNWRTSMQSTG